ncbi:MAG TPA: PEGA domain-containing protein [Patescibacteria group bacterium]|nr:PEGA domain-containing protein [Patescibacteria group bacterium]
MDFFDPKKQKSHAIRLGVGYALIGLALVLATTILVYQAYGFGIDKNGQVIQNGLVFLSSQPKSADIYVNNQKYKSQTNTRMTVPAGQYTVRITRSGYRDWKRVITVDGGSVERFDYSVLFPKKLVTTAVKQYSAAPALAVESNDRRWLLVTPPGTNDFDLFDLGNATKPISKTLTIPAEVLTASTDTQNWQLVKWAGDNRHALLRRNYQNQKDGSAGSEYILLDTQDPTQSKNLSQLLGFTPTTIELRNNAYDQYYAYDQPNGTVFTATLKKPTPQLYLEKVLNFTADKNTVLYATSQDATTGKVLIRLRQNADPAHTLRTVSAGNTYLLDLATYDGTPYVAAGAQSENKVYVYEDPIAELKDAPSSVVAPVQILKVTNPTYLVFSDNARFVMAENADHFAVYDAQTDKGYAYQVKTPLDAPQTHAAWMDGYHLDLVSGGKVQVFDFDGANVQGLSAASPSYLPLFNDNYTFMYTMSAQNALTSTTFLTPEDK